MKLGSKAIARPLRFHDLRHWRATILLRAGVDAYRVQRILRHRDIRTTTGTYAHLDLSDVRQGFEMVFSEAPAPATFRQEREPRRRRHGRHAY
jgi:integrase